MILIWRKDAYDFRGTGNLTNQWEWGSKQILMLAVNLLQLIARRLLDTRKALSIHVVRLHTQTPSARNSAESQHSAGMPVTETYDEVEQD